MKKFFSIITLQNWLLRFACVQLFLSLLSAPILLAWGLPVSLLSPLGNLIFGPVITAFLFISSLIFFCELLHLPNSWLIICLDTLTSWWLTCMHADNKTWLVGFVKPSIICLIGIPILTIVIMHKTINKPLLISFASLLILAISTSLYLKSIAHLQPAITEIPCNKGSLTVVCDKHQVVLIDPGYLGQSTAAPSWAQYTLMPAIIQSVGSTTIDHLIVLQPSNMVFQALERLCTTMGINHIYIPFWEGQLSPSGLRSFYALKRIALAKGITIKRIGTKAHTLVLENNNYIRIEPLLNDVRTQEISYPAFACCAHIDNQEITIYSAKCVKKKALENDIHLISKTTK